MTAAFGVFLGFLCAVWRALAGILISGVLLVLALVSMAFSRYLDWRGGPPCQSCGCRNTRSWIDGGKRFTVCEQCLEEIMSR